ncbi:MAG: metalloregulator ArsR/SmtB family transcription factor [Myxococcota bacterium]
MALESRERARDRVLLQLKLRGPQSAAQLARRLAVTPMAIRQHLRTLADEGLVDFEDERRPVGRPARVFRLRPEASARFPDAHADLTLDLLGSMQEAFGEEGMERLLAARHRRQLASYRSRVPRDAPIEKRVRALAALRRDEGYMAEWSRTQPGFLLVENHCPICAAASACQGLCRDELALFREVLGEDVHVEREEHLLSGARRCAYRIAPRE